jgi:hypothetical protein
MHAGPRGRQPPRSATGIIALVFTGFVVGRFAIVALHRAGLSRAVGVKARAMADPGSTPRPNPPPTSGTSTKNRRAIRIGRPHIRATVRFIAERADPAGDSHGRWPP